ncbi:HAD hydrolase, subfamily IA [Candidatus Methylopumilus universalis]|uniref:HAD-IIIA family hydrolase n=1 Tax=Candidatus Methylopumilus universalis TaxID=2588536 RepID=UPI003BEECAEB
MNNITQAVVLCGGLGMRLRPLTDNLPKPMVMVNGSPFLHHLLKQLSEQGISRFVLLTGYLGEKISDYFGDGTRFGWSIIYSHGPVEWDTGRRIWEGKDLYDPQFLLMYSDNFVQFNLHKLSRLHKNLGSPITLLLAHKEKGNIKASAEGVIEAYDKTRNGFGFDYVEVGYMIIERDQVLSHFHLISSDFNFNFSAILHLFAEQKNMAGLVIYDPYHSISDTDRLALTCKYLEPKKILLIDRDGTINVKAPKGEYISIWEGFTWINETRLALSNLAREGFKFIIITNQAGISRGMLTTSALEDIHQNMVNSLLEDGIEVLRIYTCPDHWDQNSFRRKPSPGMFFEASKDFNLRLDHCLYVGDDERDCQAAANAGCGMVYLTPYNDELSLDPTSTPLFVSKTLEDSLDAIKNAYSNWAKTDV